MRPLFCTYFLYHCYLFFFYSQRHLCKPETRHEAIGVSPPNGDVCPQCCPLCEARGELCGSCCFWMTLGRNFPLISAVVCAVSEEKHRSFLLEGRVTTTCTCAGLSSLPVCNRRRTQARLASARSSGYECSKKLRNALVRAVGVFLAPCLLMPHCHAVLWAARCTQVQASFSSPPGCSSAL